MAMPKSKKKNNRSKTAVNSLKKQLTSKLIAIILVAVLLISVAGYYGVQAYSKHEIKAAAAGWTLLYSAYGTKISACKVGYNSPYGYIRTVKVFTTTSASNYAFSLGVYRYGKLVNTNTKRTNWGRSSFLNEVPTAEVTDDTYVVNFNNFVQGLSAYNSGLRNPAYLSNC